MAWNPFGWLNQEKPKAHSSPPVIIPGSDTAPAPVRFACRLFSALSREYPGENIFISPASISFALALCYNGSAGETQAEMATALELQGLSVEAVNDGAKILKTLLERREPKVELAIANSLWSRIGVSFKPPFLETARKFYSAEARELDFSSDEAANTINRWVSDKTRGKIQSVVGRDLRNALLVLINALYFNGKWSEDYEFKPESTADGPFKLLSGKSKNLPLMRQGNTYRYHEDDFVHAVRMPYGEGHLGMYVVLPKPEVDFKQFCRDFQAVTWETWVRAMQSREGYLIFPKFRLEYEIELNQTLKALGMPRAFEQTAQFPHMADTPLKIGLVKHKTLIDVKEEGTEAAAVTAVIMAAGCAAPEATVKPFQMIVDRPFICAIRDDRTGTLLFMGAIVEP